ncbi:MAG: hypothetical protein WC068_16845 [Caulobacter sp.]
MRRLVACLLLSLTLAAPAAAQQGRIDPDPPSLDQAALKGAVGVVPQAASMPDETPPLLPPPVQPTGLAESSVSGSQCRLACSQTYYFCLAGEDDRCPQYWSRCVSGCG